MGRRFHERIGAPWPCAETTRFDRVWTDVVESLVSQDLRVGRGAFGGWDDADSALARAVWCLALHLKPKVTVETGVARGLTTRLLLEAMERNGSGSLFSVDLPPLIRRDLAVETGAAVPASLRTRWTCVSGSSHRRLPALLDRLHRVDLFLHDSSHTKRNVLFELERVWNVLVDGGVALVDDVGYNRGFALFTAGKKNLWSIVGRKRRRRRPDRPSRQVAAAWSSRAPRLASDRVGARGAREFDLAARPYCMSRFARSPAGKVQRESRGAGTGRPPCG